MIDSRFFILFSFICWHHVSGETVSDKEIVEKCLWSISSSKPDSVSGAMVQSALFLLETPYVGGTLEVNAKEELVINLRELDCTTLVENCLALSLTHSSGKDSFETFTNNLQKIRYRKGEINGYLSRLHYSSDWIYENETSGYLKDITQEIGGRTWPLRVSFMSSNASLYPHLKKHPEDIPFLKATEDSINARQHDYIPKEEIPACESNIQDGDLIYFVTSIEGLDISHVGIAYRINGRLTFIHASSKAKKVIVNPESLSEYCKRSKSNLGIVVCRINNGIN